MIMARSAKEVGTRDRPDERRQFLTYMKPDLIKNLKVAAMEEERAAYELIEDAVTAFLKERKRK
jgi:hypothetical protein